MNHWQVQKRHRRRGESDAERRKTGKVTSWTNKIISEISIFSQMTFNRFFPFVSVSFNEWPLCGASSTIGISFRSYQWNSVFFSCFFAWINVWTTANTNDQSTHNWMQRIFHLIKCYSLRAARQTTKWNTPPFHWKIGMKHECNILSAQ